MVLVTSYYLILDLCASPDYIHGEQSRNWEEQGREFLLPVSTRPKQNRPVGLSGYPE